MVQVTRGAQFPLVTVRTRLPESAAASATINADLEIQFAGQTVQYKQVPFKLEMHGGELTSQGQFRPHSPISKSTRPRF